MKDFIWQGINQHGKKVAGIIQAPKKSLAYNAIINQGISPTSLRANYNLFFTHSKIHFKHITSFTRELSTLLSANLPLIKALDIVASGTQSTALKHLTMTLQKQIEKGLSFSEALVIYPKYFDAVYRGIVFAGEQSGSLSQCLAKLADYLERLMLFKFKIKKALTYPIIVLIISLIITLAMILFVVPEFQKVYAELNGRLPLFTQWIINLAMFIRHYGIFILSAITVISIGLYPLRRIEILTRTIDYWVLKLPIIQRVLRHIYIARWCRIMTTTLNAGVPLIKALQISANAINNYYYQKELNKIIYKIESGYSLYHALQSIELFPQHIIQTIAAGENSSSLPLVLQNTAEICQTKLDHGLDSLAQLLEPILLLIIAILVGGLIIAMYLPIFKLGSVI